MRFIRLGKPTHLKSDKQFRSNWTACGLNDTRTTEKYADVDCCRCRKTQQFKNRPKVNSTINNKEK